MRAALCAHWRSMTRKVVVAALVVVVIAVALWLMLRGRGHSPAPDTTERPRSAAVAPPQAPAKQLAAGPRGPATRWVLDADAEGPLRLEGQVVDGDGHGVGGAAVWLSSVPQRTTRSED